MQCQTLCRNNTYNYSVQNQLCSLKYCYVIFFVFLLININILIIIWLSFVVCIHILLRLIYRSIFKIMFGFCYIRNVCFLAAHKRFSVGRFKIIIWIFAVWKLLQFNYVYVNMFAVYMPRLCILYFSHKNLPNHIIIIIYCYIAV